MDNGNGHLPTTQQVSELTSRNDGFLHHNVMVAAGLLPQAQCWYAALVHPRVFRFLS